MDGILIEKQFILRLSVRFSYKLLNAECSMLLIFAIADGKFTAVYSIFGYLQSVW